jgi:hypothetical protein
MAIFLDSNYKNDARVVGHGLSASMSNENMTKLFTMLLDNFTVRCVANTKTRALQVINRTTPDAAEFTTHCIKQRQGCACAQCPVANNRRRRRPQLSIGGAQ